jgi:hypothetical protein
VATHSSERPSPEQHNVAELTVRGPRGDLLDVEPLDLGPGAPATSALELERGTRPHAAREGGEQ